VGAGEALEHVVDEERQLRQAIDRAQATVARRRGWGVGKSVGHVRESN
jgi:hypothetical protein